MKLYTFLPLPQLWLRPLLLPEKSFRSNKLVTKTVSVSSFDELDAGWAHVIVNIR